MMVLRERFNLDDRAFTVLADPWFDDGDAEWKGRLLFLPLDRSMPAAVGTGPIHRSTRRDDVVEWLRSLPDPVIARSLRTITSSTRRRGR